MGMLAHSAYAQDTLDLAQAEQQLRSGQGEQVYEALQAHEFDQAGDPEFDYLLGASAIEAGHPDRATLALERVLAVTPNHGGARLDMGRAYFTLGDMTRAREELLLAQKLNPPEAARAIIEQYLAAIKARETAAQTRTSAYAELGIGNDSNVTQGPINSTAFLPAFKTNFTLNQANQKRAADFGQINLGGEVLHKLNETRSVYAGIDVKLRSYSAATSYDYASTDLRAGLQVATERNTWRLGVGLNDYTLVQQPYRQIYSLNGEWARALTPRRQLMFYGQYAAARYLPEAQRNNNADQWLAGGGLTMQLIASKPTLLNMSAFLGQEAETDPSLPRIDGNKDFYGLRAAMQWALRSDLDLIATTSAQSASYQRTNLLYQTKRADTVLDASLNAVWRFAPHGASSPSSVGCATVPIFPSMTTSASNSQSCYAVTFKGPRS